MAGFDDLSDEERAQLMAALKSQGAPGVVSYDNAPVTKDGATVNVPAPPPTLAPGVDLGDALMGLDAQLVAALKSQGAPGVVSYDNAPVTKDGATINVPAPPPRFAPGVDPADAMMHMDARSMATGAAQQRRAAGGDDPALVAQAKNLVAMGASPEEAAQRLGLSKAPDAAPGADAGAAGGGGIFAQPAAAPPPFGPRGGGGPAYAFVDRLSPEAKSAYGVADAAQVDALKKDRDIAQMNYAKEGQLAKVQGMQVAAQGMGEKWAEDRRQTKAETEWQKLEDERQRYMSMEVSPEHFWSTKNTGQKIGLILGQAISDFGAGFSGHPELAGRMINTLIDRDIEAQKANIIKAHGALEAHDSLYGRMLARFGDERLAAAASRQVMHDQMEIQGKAMAAETGSATAEARTALLLAQLQEKQADRIANEFQLTKMGGGAKSPIGQNMLVPMEDGSFVAAATEKDATDLKEAMASRREFDRLGNEALRIREENPYTWFVPGSQAHGQISGVQSRMTIAANHAENLNRLSEVDKQLQQEAAGDVMSYSPSATEAIRANLARNKQSGEEMLRGRGVLPAQSGFVRDPKTGQLMPYAQYTGQRYAPPSATGGKVNLMPPTLPPDSKGPAK